MNETRSTADARTDTQPEASPVAPRAAAAKARPQNPPQHMPKTSPQDLPAQGLPRLLLRWLAVAALCGLLQAWLPAYGLGATDVPPLSLVLGVTVAVALSRGAATLPAAVLGVVLGELWGGGTPTMALAEGTILAAQTGLVLWLMRSTTDPEAIALDDWPRLKRLVLRAAPAAAVLGVVLHLLADGLLGGAWPAPRALLAVATGRLLADWSGTIIAVSVLLCWLARPMAPWRLRRRMLAAPMLLLVLVMLPGFHELARRDEARLNVRFQWSASDRLWRAQRLLAEPLDALAALRGALAVADLGGRPLPTAMFDRLAGDWARRLPGLAAAGWAERAPDGSLRGGHVFTSAAPAAAADRPGVPPPGLLRQAARAFAGDHPFAVPAGGPDATAPALAVAQPLPAGAEQPARLVYLVVRSDLLLAAALPAMDDPNLVACLIDSGDGADGGSVLRLAGAPHCEAGGLGHLARSSTERVALADRTLRLVVAEPVSADDRLFTAVWLLALPAVTGAALLATLLLALSGRLLRIEDRVRERTAALRAEIDERRRAEAQLVQSEQRFRAIFDSVNIGVTLVDMDGRIVAANPAFCTLMGCAPDALLQRPLADFRLPDVAEDDGTAAAVAGSHAKRQRYLTADGRVLQVAASLRTLCDADGKPVATVGALADLTPVLHLREAERERDEAAIANRTKSEFLARLSHELRAPLNAIMGFAQMLGNRDDGEHASPAARQHGLDQIRQAGWHLLDMINDVLDLSRMEAGSLRLTLEPVSLADIAQEAMAMVEPAAQQGQVTLALSLSPLADRVQADPLRLRQVLINLLANAVRYNRRGGHVELRARPAGVGDVVIEVHDTGVGIAAEQMGELFTPFNRLGRDARERPASGSGGDGGGTGIGLVICRRLAELMAGEISVSSTVGEGSVFSLRLPKAQGEPQRVEVNAGPMLTLASTVSIGSVLYIEDRDSDVAVMRGLLAARPGVTLHIARSAADGLAQAAEADLVLLDLDLPDRPGLSVLRALRADSRLRHTPVVVVSGDSSPARIDECFEAGATDYLTKPLDAVPLLRAIDEALKGV